MRESITTFTGIENDTHRNRVLSWMALNGIQAFSP